jgi:K+-sensing histidine kinase KdpD
MSDANVPWLDRLAHDLRGPLAPLQTASYLLQREDLDPARRQELLQLVERQSRRLSRMLEELEDWARACQGRLLGTREPCEAASLLDSALVGAGLSGTPIDDDGTATVLHADQRRAMQALRTMLEFAAASGGVSQLRLRHDDDEVVVEIQVAGSAPSDDALGRLFAEPQADPFDEGLGLRLLLARRIAQAHGGDLEAVAGSVGLLLRCRLPLAGGEGAASAQGG